MKILDLIKSILKIVISSKVIKGDVGKVLDKVDPDLIDVFISSPNTLLATSKTIPAEPVIQRQIVDHNLPKEFEWIYKIGQIPKTMQIAFSFCGLLEYKGKANNPTIINWAKELHVSSYYNEDSISWCGLGQAIAVLRAGYPVPANFLAAKSWLKYGNQIPIEGMSFGDIVVLNRDNNPALGHVARYIGETKDLVCLYGANQSDSWCFAWFSKDRIAGVRQDPFKIGVPPSVKKYMLARGKGLISNNEA